MSFVQWKQIDTELRDDGILTGSLRLTGSFFNIGPAIFSGSAEAWELKSPNITVGTNSVNLLFEPSSQLVFNSGDWLYPADTNLYKITHLQKDIFSNSFLIYKMVEDGFNIGAGADGSVFSTVVQPDGKIIIGGNFTSYSGSSINRIARINTDGTLDSTFNVGTGASSDIYTTTLQPDGKIIIGGNFTSYSGSSINRLARINTDGTQDTSFNVGTGANSLIYATAVQPDSKLIIAGEFTSYSGSSRSRIARINTDGTLDTTFNIGTGASSGILTTTLQPDGKVIIGGVFTSYSGSTRNYIARINTDGTLDTTFNVGTGANGEVRTTALQPDGKIIIGGFFTSYSGSSINRLARINTDGTLDTTFNVGTGASSGIRTTTLQPDGKIMIGGDFTSYSGSSINGITRINTDGTLDTTFNVGTGANGSIIIATLQPDGKIIIGGFFTSYNSIPQNRITRLTEDGDLDKTLGTIALEDGKSYLFKITGVGTVTNTSALVDFDLHANMLYDIQLDTFSITAPYQMNRGTLDQYDVTATLDSTNRVGLNISGITPPRFLHLKMEIIETIAQGSGGYYGSY